MTEKSSSGFKHIAVIGAGTMGSGIAAQIANAGLKVILLDLPSPSGKGPSAAEAAITRLLKSEPPQLMHPDYAAQITTGTIEDDFEKLAQCDLVIEAVVERLDIKKALYKRLDATVCVECIVTSNTSTIPISILTQDMPAAFCQRFAITHYFNPVRYMRLLELVRGTHTTDAVMQKLADFNDRIIGKGVVICNDTPGFLGNRVGVYALQVGLHEALRAGISIEEADALMGRPVGIPKTGIFGLYDLIGIDLMSDVVRSLRSILPEGDAFHEVGFDPELVTQMIRSGYTGQKGKGGFYRTDSQAGKQVRALETDQTGQSWRAVSGQLPAAAERAADAQTHRREPLEEVLKDNSPAGLYARRCLVRILAYAASLIPEITASPQDIDDAMKLGFNWQRGPFEMIDAIGTDRLKGLAAQTGINLPAQLQNRTTPYYRVDKGRLEIDVDDKGYQPVKLGDGVMRLSMLRPCLEVIAQNDAASLYRLAGDVRLVEFHSKANALNDLSMQIVQAAADNPGQAIVIHNDAQHFSAGVDLTHFQYLIEHRDWQEIDAFLDRFQRAVKALKYLKVPVIGAPSGLAAGGGFEVLMHCDRLVAHNNSVLGLVESGVGLVPSGGGVKETYLRWYQHTGNWDDAAWKTWMQIGYGATGSSPELSAKYLYFRTGHDHQIMSRDRLLSEAIKIASQMQADYQPPQQPEVQLARFELREKMDSFMQDGVDKGLFTPHNKTVAMAIASIVVAAEGESQQSDEQGLFDRERQAFIELAKTQQTADMIRKILAG